MGRYLNKMEERLLDEGVSLENQESKNGFWKKLGKYIGTGMLGASLVFSPVQGLKKDFSPKIQEAYAQEKAYAVETPTEEEVIPEKLRKGYPLNQIRVMVKPFKRAGPMVRKPTSVGTEYSYDNADGWAIKMKMEKEFKRMGFCVVEDDPKIPDYKEADIVIDGVYRIEGKVAWVLARAINPKNGIIICTDETRDDWGIIYAAGAAASGIYNNLP